MFCLAHSNSPLPSQARRLSAAYLKRDVSTGFPVPFLHFKISNEWPKHTDCDRMTRCVPLSNPHHPEIWALLNRTMRTAMCASRLESSQYFKSFTSTDKSPKSREWHHMRAIGKLVEIHRTAYLQGVIQTSSPRIFPALTKHQCAFPKRRSTPDMYRNG